MAKLKNSTVQKASVQDLRVIAEEFNKFLTGHYHKRIEYPKSKDNQD